MNSIKEYLESIRHYSFPKTRALEHELDAVRKAHVAVSADLAKVRENLQLTHEDDAQLLANLERRLRQIESEHSNARERVESLERLIADAEQRQKSTQEHAATLEAKLEGDNSNARERAESLEHTIANAEQRQKSAEEHVAALEVKLEGENSNARERVESLERLIDDAGQRQKSAEEHVAALEVKLEGENSSARERVESLERLIADAEQRQRSTQEHAATLEAKLEGGNSSARERVESLEHTIANAEQRQKSAEEHVAALEVKFEGENSNARERVESLERLIADAGQRQKLAEEHVAAQEAKLEGEHSSARERVESLERSIADAEQRQKSTEGHVVLLETKFEEKLKEERSRHEASTHATEAFLARMQDDQQSHLKRIPELENNLQGIAARLQDSLEAASKKPQYSLQKLMVIVGILFAAGTLAGVLIMQALQDREEELAVVKEDIREMGVFMKQHLDNQDTVLNNLTLALNRQTSSDLALIENMSLAHEAETPEADKQPQKALPFTPDISELQAGLIMLGFDLGISRPNGELGIKTRQALQEFRQFYLPDSDSQDEVVTEPLAALILKSADLVRADVARFNINSDVVAAIRLGSIRTGVDFSFLMEMAKVESYFNPTVHAAKSSATGLFQFKDYAWLESIRTFGADYGLMDYATKVKLIDDEEHEQQPIVRDPLQLEVLALRLNPRLSALMAAENIKRNLQILSASTGRAPVRTNLYLAHFLGPDATVIFLKTLDEEPATIASDIFPKEAVLNPGVFQNRKRQPRTVAEVYRWFDSKFNIARYDDRNPG